MENVPRVCSAAGAQVGQTYNLGKVERVISDSIENKVLQPVDNVEELLTQRSHGADGAGAGAVSCAAPGCWSCLG